MQIKHHLLPIIIAITLMLVGKPDVLKIRQTLSYFISPIYALIEVPYQFYNWVFEYGQDRESLLNQINQLKYENTALKAQLQTHHNTLIELNKLKKFLQADYQIGKSNTQLVTVNHINQSRFSKKIIINKGSNDGIKVGQVAIGTKGIIGQVFSVNPYYSSVLAISDATHYISVKNNRSNIRAIAQGMATYNHKLKLNFVPKNSDIKVSDVFVSSQLAPHRFPQNHPLAIVSKVDNTHPTFMNVELTPVEAIDQLEFMLIITDEK